MPEDAMTATRKAETAAAITAKLRQDMFVQASRRPVRQRVATASWTRPKSATTATLSSGMAVTPA